jgi:hypothetical protein
VLYISGQVGEMFRFGVEQAYSDTYPFISTQPYIEAYKIHKGEPYDINLSSWRSNLGSNINWNKIYNHHYNVNWGSHSWLTIDPSIPVPAHVEGKVLFSCSTFSERYPSSIDFNKLFDTYGKDSVVFITQNRGEYETFVSKTGIQLPLYTPSTLQEMVACIAKSSLYIGNLSSPLTYAYALHKNNITLLCPGRCDNWFMYGLDAVLPVKTLEHN